MKIIGLFVCIFLLFLPPTGSGISLHQQSEGAPPSDEWTILEGRITKPSHVQINGGDYVEFNCFFVHYSTRYQGNIRAGWFHDFDRIVLPEVHYGFLGNRWVFAQFFTSLIP